LDLVLLDEDAMPALHRTRYRSLDLWRGVACLTVVAYHASGVVQRGASPDWSEPVYSALGLGYLGVPLFFVISGYCIAASSDAHRQSGAGGGSFLWRRLRRIYPPYWISVGCTVMLFWTFDALGWGLFHKGPAAQPAVASLSWVQWLGNLTLSETWLHQVIGGEERRFNGAIWSLCFEEQFYLLCFLALTTMPRRFVQVILLLTCAVTLVWASAELLGARERF
jgi:peptidoglycan/LPS O-acetylase OafA/YrhL